MELKVTWSELKQFVQARNLSVQWFVNNGLYWLAAIDGSVELSTQISIKNPTPSGSDQQDFETNFKSLGNQSPSQNSTVQSQPPYGAKTVVVSGVTHKLFARFTGIQATVNLGVNTITYTATYPWAKMIGIEVINCTALDTANLIVYDSPQGTYSGTPNAPLSQFSYNMNLPAGFYERMAQFDADVYAGMAIKIIYTSVASTANTVGINFLLNQVV
jgi:hypothetical protein